VADPQFVDPEHGDFRLKNTSPAIDAGTMEGWYPTTDFYGNPRPQGRGIDIGAIEYPSDYPGYYPPPGDPYSYPYPYDPYDPYNPDYPPDYPVIDPIVDPYSGLFVGLFGILNEQFTDTPYELPEATNPLPESNIQTSGSIGAWIDIVGFRYMLREGETDYVPGPPNEYALVMHLAWANINCGGCSVDSLDQETDVRIEGDMTVAELRVTLRWHQTVCSVDIDGDGVDDTDPDASEPPGGENAMMTLRLDDGDGNGGDDDDDDDDGGSGAPSLPIRCSTSNYVETATFIDVENSPEVYNITLQNFTVYITEYNNTISPKVSIAVPRQEGMIKATINYANETAIRYYGIGTVELTEKRVPILNMTRKDFWLMPDNASVLYRMGDRIMINGTTLDYSQLNVTVSTPYTSLGSADYNITRLDYSPEKTWSPMFFLVLGMTAIFVFIGRVFWRML
jgi:hypothetical protein